MEEFREKSQRKIPEYLALHTQGVLLTYYVCSITLAPHHPDCKKNQYGATL